jgi:hypothetical protein
MIIFSQPALGPQQTSSVQSSVPFPSAPSASANKKYAKTLRLTSDQLVRRVRMILYRELTLLLSESSWSPKRIERYHILLVCLWPSCMLRTDIFVGRDRPYRRV